MSVPICERSEPVARNALSQCSQSGVHRPVIAIGPELPGWGSWDWIGHDLAEELSPSFSIAHFNTNRIPTADIIFVVKHPLSAESLKTIPCSTKVIYCPVDHYASPWQIDGDASWLRRCSRIVVHCERLKKYFADYAPVEYLDHHVKFVRTDERQYLQNAPILWVGVRTNLPYLIEWVNSHRLQRQLVVLTNPESPSGSLDPSDFGFDRNSNIRIEQWSPDRHLQWLVKASAALDIKGDDFRQRHKPPTKAIDFIAAGLPLAMNAGTSSGEHLARLGFEVADPEDFEMWFSRQYWEETQRFGAVLREMLSRPRVAYRLKRILDEVLIERALHTPV